MNDSGTGRSIHGSIHVPHNTLRVALHRLSCHVTATVSDMISIRLAPGPRLLRRQQMPAGFLVAFSEPGEQVSLEEFQGRCLSILLFRKHLDISGYHDQIGTIMNIFPSAWISFLPSSPPLDSLPPTPSNRPGPLCTTSTTPRRCCARATPVCERVAVRVRPISYHDWNILTAELATFCTTPGNRN